jgi:hypothetical protein
MGNGGVGVKQRPFVVVPHVLTGSPFRSSRRYSGGSTQGVSEARIEQRERGEVERY